MLKNAAYGLSASGTIVTLALRFLDVEPMLTFGISAVAILGLAFTRATPRSNWASRPVHASAAS